MFDRRRMEDEEHENHERWLVSYADMITLLAALFIVLFAMSRIDLKKFDQFSAGLRGAFGGASPGVLDPTGRSAIPEGSGAFEGMTLSKVQLEQAGNVLQGQADAAAAAEQATLRRTQAQLEAHLSAAGLERAVKFRMESRGLVVNIITDEVLFDSGSAVLRPEGRAVLDGLAPALLGLPNDLAVEGHTDDRPVRGGWGSNWELSVNRATAVLRYLVEERGIPVPRVYAAGYADQRPLVPNDTAAHRATNRRVELVILASELAPELDPGTTPDDTVPDRAVPDVAPDVAPDAAPDAAPDGRTR